MKRVPIVILILFAVTLASSNDLLAWSCKTHRFIAREAGVKDPGRACFADLSREENPMLLAFSHWHNASPDTVVTTDYIDRFKMEEDLHMSARYPEMKPVKIKVPHPSGILYWKIVDIYKEMTGKTGWEYEFYLINIAHYIGDLSNPLHNFPYESEPASNGKAYPEIGSWANGNHDAFDLVLDPYLPLNKREEKFFRSALVHEKIDSISDLKEQIAIIANSSIALANRCYLKKRNMTRDEALKQVALSVSLLKAVITSTQSNK